VARTAQRKRGWTVERWLRHWLDSRTGIRPTTRLHYTRDVELVLVPHLGQYRLADLDAPLLRSLFATIAQVPNSKGKPLSFHRCSCYPVVGAHHRRSTLDVSGRACWFCWRRARQAPNIRAPSH
jgi:hypothetical protein